MWTLDRLMTYQVAIKINIMDKKYLPPLLYYNIGLGVVNAIFRSLKAK